MVSILVHEQALRRSIWFYISLSGLFIFILLKAFQLSIEQEGFINILSLPRTIPMAFLRRVNDLSFAMVFATFVSIFSLAGALRIFIPRSFKHAPDGSKAVVTLNSRSQLIWVALTLFTWFLYLQAVYRDKGTFFHTWSQGTNIVLTASNSVFVLPTKAVTNTEPSAFQTPSSSFFYSPTLTSIFPEKSSPQRIYQIQLLQVIEGVFILMQIGLTLAWSVLAHSLLTMAPKPTQSDRKKPISEGYFAVAHACVSPVLVFALIIAVGLALWGHGFVGPLLEGVNDAFVAFSTIVLMWGSFIWLLFRTMNKGEEVLEWTFKPPFVRKCRDDADN